MRETSEVWNSLVQGKSFKMNVVARIYNAIGTDPNAIVGSDSIGEYREYTRITAPIITCGALQECGTLSVGNSVSATMEITVKTTDIIPKAARINILARLTNGSEDNPIYSEWVSYGHYYVNSRSITDDLISLTCYDIMIKAEGIPFEGDGTYKYIGSFVYEFADALGVDITYRTITWLQNNSFMREMVAFQFDANRTMRDAMCEIAGIMGGNWIITFENKLDFIPIIKLPPETGYIIDNSYEVITTPEGDMLIHDEIEESENTHPYEGGTVTVPIITGNLVTSEEFDISKIVMSSDYDTVYSFGSVGGFVLIVPENSLATQAYCQKLYNMLVSIGYIPFEATGCMFNPAAEIGDWVRITNRVSSVVYNMRLTLSTTFKGDLSAPSSKENEVEFLDW